MTDGKACEVCDKYFSEFDLDLVGDIWVCRDCEEDMRIECLDDQLDEDDVQSVKGGQTHGSAKMS